jgi:hypothetical protein
VFTKEYRVLIARFHSYGLLITLLREQEQMIMLIVAYTSQPDGSDLQCICHKEAQIEQITKTRKCKRRKEKQFSFVHLEMFILMLLFWSLIYTHGQQNHQTTIACKYQAKSCKMVLLVGQLWHLRGLSPLNLCARSRSDLLDCSKCTNSAGAH